MFEGMSTKQFLSKAGVCMIGATFFMGGLGVRADPSLFLLMGNFLCVIANGLFVMILDEFNPGNEKYQLMFGIFIFISAYATYVHFLKCRAAPEGYWDEDGSDDEAEQPEHEAPKRIKQGKGSKKKMRKNS